MTANIAVNQPMRSAEQLQLLALSALWGGSFFFVGVAVEELPPLTIVFIRVALASLALLAILRAAGAPMPRSVRVWAAFLGMGALNNVIPFCLIVWGQTQIASGVASILNATTPLFTVLVAHLATADEKATGGRLVGAVVGFAGVAAIIGPGALGALGGAIPAQLACLAAALSYACAGVFGRRFRNMGVAPVATAAGQVTASALLLLPAMLVVDRPWMLPIPSPATLAALAGLALLSTALAYILYFRILAAAGVTNLLVVTFLIPVSAILLGVLVLGETLAPRHFAGMALIGLGLAAIDGRPWGALRRRRQAWARATRPPASSVRRSGNPRRRGGA